MIGQKCIDTRRTMIAIRLLEVYFPYNYRKTKTHISWTPPFGIISICSTFWIVFCFCEYFQIIKLNYNVFAWSWNIILRFSHIFWRCISMAILIIVIIIHTSDHLNLWHIAHVWLWDFASNKHNNILLVIR